MKNLFRYINNTSEYKPSGVFTARVANVNGKDQLFKELNFKLNFPDYFGFNWDALDDCLNDLHWIKEKKIILIHESIPVLKNTDLGIYLRILKDATIQWENSEEHVLEIVFQKSEEIKLVHLLGSI